jgi:hypothetical protein
MTTVAISNDKIEIPLNKEKFVLMSLASLAIVILGIWLLNVDPHGSKTTLIRIFSIPIGGACSIFFAWMAFGKKNGLVVDDIGIILPNCSEQILWKNIVEIQSRKGLVIVLNNPEEYFNNCKGPFSWLNVKLDLIISSSIRTGNIFKCTDIELENILAEQYAKYRRRSKKNNP